MVEHQRDENQTGLFVPGPYKYPLLAGLCILLICASVVLYQFMAGQNRGEESEERISDASVQTMKSKDGPVTSDDHDKPVTPDTASKSTGIDQSTYPFTVRRNEDNRYVFRLRDQFDGLKSGTRVRVSLHWNEARLERYSKKVSVDDGGRVEVEWSPGNSQEQIPPGIYRIRITGREILQKPLLVSRFTEYLSEEESDDPGFRRLQETKAVEYAVSVGTGQEVRKFQKHLLCELKKRGRSLISAWRSWLETAQSSYNSERTKKEVAQNLFDRFMSVNDAVRDVRGWIETQEASYAVLPYKQLRGELLKLSYVLSKKVNAMSMTVLKQVGISPLAWPNAFVQRGFGSNINVLRHMSQYDRETMQDVENVMDNTELTMPYSDLKTYAMHRIRRLFQFINQVRVLDSHPYLPMLELQLSGTGEKKKYRFRSLHTYVQEVIRIRERGLTDIVADIEHDRIRTSFLEVLDLFPVYARVVLIRLADSFDLSPSEILDPSGEVSASPDTLHSQIQKEIDRIASNDRVQLPIEEDCE